MKLKIDKEKCIGCGTCEALCPEVFKLEGNIAKVITEDEGILKKNEKCIKDSMEACAQEAITKN